MNNKPNIISKEEYIELNMKAINGFTLTKDELRKLEIYENPQLAYAPESQGKGNATVQEKGPKLSISNSAGKYLAHEEDSQGFVNPIVVIGAAVITGIIAAILVLGL